VQSPAPLTHHIHIRAQSGFALNLRELWAYRELLYFLIWRDIKVRYKQTIFGAAWAIIQPVMLMLVFSIFFGHFIGVPSDGIPYPIFSYAALVPWSFFATGMTTASATLVNNANLIKKTYFPRLMAPTATVLAGLVDFTIAFIILILMMLFYGIMPTIKLIWLPLFLLIAVLTTIGVSLWLSAINVRYRDVRHIVPFLAQFWMYITPIAYPSSVITSEPIRLLYSLNPMAGVVDGFRWALLGQNTPPNPTMLISIAVALLLFISGLFYFRRSEDTFADVV
jgi:lipopolysaccharide transport system permease protein